MIEDIFGVGVRIVFDFTLTSLFQLEQWETSCEYSSCQLLRINSLSCTENSLLVGVSRQKYQTNLYVCFYRVVPEAPGPVALRG